MYNTLYNPNVTCKALSLISNDITSRLGAILTMSALLEASPVRLINLKFRLSMKNILQFRGEMTHTRVHDLKLASVNLEFSSHDSETDPKISHDFFAD